MYKSKNKSTSSSDVSAEKPPITIEEIDCERRGYKLTDKTLGTGAYAKVKLAYVSPSKRVKHPWLKADLDGKDDNRVIFQNCLLFRGRTERPIPRGGGMLQEKCF